MDETYCTKCQRAHQPRERTIPCARCGNPTLEVHGICAHCLTIPAPTKLYDHERHGL